MTLITVKGQPTQTCGILPRVGTVAPDFTLAKTDLSDVTLHDFAGKDLILNVFPSIDTAVCATSVRRFNSEVSGLKETSVLCISADLPFSHGRFCSAEGIRNVSPLSCFRSSFGKDYGLEIMDGPLRGLLSRAIVLINKNGKIIYTEQVPEIAQEPDYPAVFDVLNQKKQ